MAMLLGCIADDFTGASDLANAPDRGGMGTAPLNGVAVSSSAEGAEAGVARPGC